MALYSERWDKAARTITAQGISGTRVYFDNPDKPTIDSLPVVDETPWNDNLANAGLLARQIHSAAYAFPAGGSTILYEHTVEYSTNSGGETSWRFPTDPDARSWQYGGEIVSVRDPTGWTWPDASALSQQVYKKISTGSFTIARTFNSKLEADGFRLSIQTTYGGRVNSVAFEGYGAGVVLLEGYSGSTTTNADGDPAWVFQMLFRWRVIPDNTIVINHWNYVMRGDTGTWDTPLDPNGDTLYPETADFNALLP